MHCSSLNQQQQKEASFLGMLVWCFGEGNGNPLQCSCLENPRNRGAWWAATCGVAQSRTQLKRLSMMHACIGAGSDNPLQYSCLENPRYRGAWWAAVCGAAQSWTQLKRLSSSSSSSSSSSRVWCYLSLVCAKAPEVLFTTDLTPYVEQQTGSK